MGADVSRNRSSRGALPGRFLRRVAERLCSPVVNKRVVLPLLADMQFEYARARGAGARLGIRLRWLLAFCQSLGLQAARAGFDHLRLNFWGSNQTERQVARLLLPRASGAIALLALVLLLDQSGPGLPLPSLRRAVLLLPSVLCVAIPAGLLLGTAWAFGGRSCGTVPWRSLLGLATLAGLMTFFLGAWVTPRANHSFRRLALGTTQPSAGTPTHPPGDRELSWGELNRRASQLRADGHLQAAARLEVEWHKKPALGMSCLSLTLVGAALTRRLRSRWRLWLVALLVPVGWLLLFNLGEQAADHLRVAPALAMWTPGLLLGALALLGLRTGARAGGIRDSWPGVASEPNPS